MAFLKKCSVASVLVKVTGKNNSSRQRISILGILGSTVLCLKNNTEPF